MRFSYDRDTGRFVVSELGRIVDWDIDPDALVAWYGFVAPSEETDMTDEEAQEMVEDFLKCE